jgi:hypothetical protein
VSRPEAVTGRDRRSAWRRSEASIGHPAAESRHQNDQRMPRTWFTELPRQPREPLAAGAQARARLGEVQGELFTGALVRPPTEVSVAQVHKDLLAARRATAGERHGRGGRSGPAGVDQCQRGGVSLHEHARDRGGLLRPPAARRHEPVGRQIRFLRLREMRLVGGGDHGDVGFEIRWEPQGGQQRARRCALIGNQARPIDHVHDERPTATMRVAFAESGHGPTKPPDSARRDGRHWHRIRRVVQGVTGHALHDAIFGHPAVEQADGSWPGDPVQRAWRRECPLGGANRRLRRLAVDQHFPRAEDHRCSGRPRVHWSIAGRQPRAARA